MTRFAISVTPSSGWTVLGQIARLFVNLVKALNDRREVMHLAEFDDRMLKDIGLLRSDVDSALAEPLFHNPSWVLVQRTQKPPRSKGVNVPAPQVRPVVPLARRSEACA